MVLRTTAAAHAECLTCSETYKTRLSACMLFRATFT